MKGLVIALVLMFLGTMCFADTVGGTSRLEYSINIKNKGGEPLTSIIPTTTLRPKIDKLVGYSCIPYDGSLHSEVYIGIFDGTDVQLSGECFGEDEADNDNGGIKDGWPRGKKIVDGVVTRQGANTDLQLYFIRE